MSAEEQAAVGLNRWMLRTLLALSMCAGLMAACDKQGASNADAGADADVGTTSVCNQYRASSPRPSPTITPFMVVQVDPNASAPSQLALQACAGLQNRKVPGSVFVEAESYDATWLDELKLTPAATVSASDFLGSCVAAFPACVRYDYKAQQALLPSILTVAAALGAVPVDNGLNLNCGSVAFDAVKELADKNTPALATQYVFDNYVEQTTGMAMLDPGYDPAPADPANPAITRDMNPGLVDFVFSERLFVVYLVNGCINGNAEKDLLSSIVNAGNWPTPLAVYGYNDTWSVGGGDLYEAETLCLNSHNMGAIASVTGNLSFYSTRSPPIANSDVVTQNALESISYDPNKTYVAFVVGDGDNIDFIKTGRHDWFRQRLTACSSDGAACPPLTWTISPHLPRLAPDLLTWYYDQSHVTGTDYFVLPPSGDLYAYPSSLAEDDQNRFVTATEEDACILGVTGTVHWDWVGTWHIAEDHFLPKYGTAGGSIRGVFPVNVPYLLQALPWWPYDQFYEVLAGADGGELALFRPREWRGVNNDSDPNFLSPQAMADEITSYPKGTVTWVYMTSDGGLSLENSFLAVTPLLPSYVQLVSTDTAAKLALAAGQQ